MKDEKHDICAQIHVQIPDSMYIHVPPDLSGRVLHRPVGAVPASTHTMMDLMMKHGLASASATGATAAFELAISL